MTRSRFFPGARIVAVILALSLNSPAMAQVTCATPDADAGLTFNGVLQTVGNGIQSAFKAMQQVYNDLTAPLIQNTSINSTLQTNNQLALAKTITETQKGNALVITKTGDGINQQATANHTNSLLAQEQISHQTQPIALALCPQASVAVGLGPAAVAVNALLTEPANFSQNITSVQAEVSSGVLASHPSMTFRPAIGQPQMLTEQYNDITNLFCDTNSDGKSCSSPHADTGAVNFFRDTTWTSNEKIAFRQFEKYVCPGLLPDNTPTGSGPRSENKGQAQLVAQHGEVGRHNMCLQAFEEYEANHTPVTGAGSGATAALASIYQVISNNGVSAPSGSLSSYSRSDLMYALTRGMLEGQQNGMNTVTTIAGQGPADSLKMIAASLLLNNYMLYDINNNLEKTARPAIGTVRPGYQDQPLSVRRLGVPH